MSNDGLIKEKMDSILNAWPNNQSESMDFFLDERVMAYDGDNLT